MAAEIATAYVRIRPNMAGFKPGVESGVRSAFRDIAKIAGVAFGAVEAFKFGKDIIQHAADLQKQVEAVGAEFGAASKEVTEFAENGAAALGISAHLADQTAARFGILFQNLGIGKKQAAEMTVGFEKLAGSLAAIRGIDPATVLKNLPLAVAGNLRSLKQLGIATDQSQLKIAAFKLGLTDSITQGLTPAQRALAIYAIATKNLGEFQRQAAAHSGDLINVERKLSAEWDNAKDALGKGLLPPVTELVHILGEVMPPAVNATRIVFHDFAEDVKQFAKFVGPAFTPIIDEVEKIKKSFSGGSGSGIAQIRKDFESLSPAGKGAVVAIGAITAAVVALVAAAFPITATVLAVAGLAVAFQQAYTHSVAFRQAVNDVGTFITNRLVPALQDIAKRAAPAFAQLYTTAHGVFEDIKTDVKQVVGIAIVLWDHFGSTIKSVVSNDFGASIRIVQDALRIFGALIDVFTGVLTGNWSKAWKGVKTIVSSELDAAKTVIVGFANDVEVIFQNLWKGVELETLQGLKAFTSLLSKVPTSFGAGTNIPGVGHVGVGVGVKNPFGGITDSLQAEIDKIKSEKTAKSIADAIADATARAVKAKTTDPSSVGQGIGDKISKGLTKGIGDGVKNGISTGIAAGADAGVAAAQEALSALNLRLKQAIAKEQTDITASVLKAKANLVTIGGNLASDIAQVLDQPFVVAGKQIQDAQDRIAAIFDAKTAKLSAAQARLSLLQSKIGLRSDQLSLDNLRAGVVLPGGKELSGNNATALRQLRALAKAGGVNSPVIQSFIQQFQSQLLQVQQDKLGIKGEKLGIAQAAKETPLQLAADRIRVQQDAVDRIKTATARQIADLTAEFNKSGNIHKFIQGITKLLTTDHASFRTAGKQLGVAFRDGFQETAQGIFQQALAISKGPQRKGTGSGQESTIVRPLVTLAKDQAAIKKIQTEIGNKQVSLQQKILKATQKTAAAAEKINSVQLGETSKSIKKNPGDQSKISKALTGTGG